jgi:cation transport protein ChaC
MRQRLTRELIAAAFPDPVAEDRTAMPLLSEAEIDASRSSTLERLQPSDDLWLFAYGSLMWNPEMEFTERRRAVLRGWHRRFCLWQWRYRGTASTPGLMMALDRGGSCTGVAFRIAAPGVSDKLAKVWKREMIGKAYRPLWITVEGPSRERLTAITFVADPKSHRYAGRLDEALVARHIATACGHAGPNATYLLETFLHCEETGIRDKMLSRMAAMVADHLNKAQMGAAGD